MPALPYQKLVSSSSLFGLLAASSADAAVVTNFDLGLDGFNIHTSRDNHIYWNIDGDAGGIAELRIEASTYNVNIEVENFANGFQIGVQAGALLNARAGDSVGKIDDFHAGSPLLTVLEGGNFKDVSGFTSGESGYIGFHFKPQDTTLYGWAEIILTEGSGGTASFEVVQWAFDDSGAGILVGGPTSAVPEPATTAAGLGLLALGAVGLRRWRQSKSPRSEAEMAK